VPDTGQEPYLVSFNFHPAAPAVSALTAPKLVVDEVEVHRQVGWKALHQGNQGLAVRFTGGAKREHIASIARKSLTLKESFR